MAALTAALMWLPEANAQPPAAEPPAIAPPAIAPDDVDCLHRDQSREGTLMRRDYCGLLSGSELVFLTDELLETTYFDADGLSCVIFGPDDYFWVREDGKFARTLPADNGCLWFEEGLSATVIDGRQSYIDLQLEPALDPGFDSLGLFRQGLATVCNGPFVYEQNGEHARRSGGECGLIDRSGRLVVDLLPAAESRRVFDDYRNAHNECPPPPIVDADSALCHARRHARNDDRRDDWAADSIELTDNVWFVSYTAPSGTEFTIYLGAARANQINHVKGDTRELFERNLLPYVDPPAGGQSTGDPPGAE
jgi:hypothetical protein